MKKWVRTEYGYWINLDRIIFFNVNKKSIYASFDVNDEPISTIFSLHESDEDAQNALDKLIQELI